MESSFEGFFDRCESYDSTAAPVPSTSSLSRNTITSTSLYTTSNDGFKTVITSVFTFQSLPPVPQTGSIPLIKSGSTGLETVYIPTTFIPLSDVLAEQATTSQNAPSGMLLDSRRSFLMMLTMFQATSPPSPSPVGTESRAWIAGPVVGSVVAAALLIFLGFFIGKRRRTRTSSSEVTESQEKTKSEPYSVNPPAEPPSELPSSPQVAELPTTHPPMELPSGEIKGHKGAAAD